MGGRVVGRRGDRAGRDFLMMGHRWRKRARCEGALTGWDSGARLVKKRGPLHLVDKQLTQNF